MHLSRDYVGYLSKQLVRRLVASGVIETQAIDTLTERVRNTITEELSVEDRINEEVRQILNDHAEEMRRTGASYQEMYKKIKYKLVRDRKVIL